MKQKLLFLLLFSFLVSFAKPMPDPTGPAIAVIMYQSNLNPPYLFFNFKIKNIGTETLTHIYVDNLPVNSSNVTIEYNDPAVIEIASLAPGEEDTVTFWGYKQIMCFDQSQTIVYATTPANTQIQDLSSNGNYYDDAPTYSYYPVYVDGSQNGVYQDANNNNLIDVGDVINYTYTMNFSSNNISFSQFVDDNAVIENPYNSSTTGIHYITQEEVDLGYVYNHSYLNAGDLCGNTVTIQLIDETPCVCPNPNGANITTPITTLLPNQISGTVRYNLNTDSCVTGTAAQNRRVETSDGNNDYVSFTNNNGQYRILIPNSGTFTTMPTLNFGSNFTISPTSTVINSSSQNQNYENNNFCLSSSTGYGNLVVSMFNTSNAVPGFNAGYYISFYNDGATTLSGSVELSFDGTKLSFLGASTNPDSTTSNTLTWNYTNLQPFQGSGIYLGFAVAVPPTANINDPMYFTLQGNPIAGDYSPADNSFSWTQIIKSSFDPNDKTVIEGSIIDIAHTDNYLHYVTRFQNTGTSNAVTVTIKENLDPKLDWDTFEPIASSHTADIQIRNDKLTYTFSNIDLPSILANEPASHGWMAYRIKPKSNVVLWDVMSSQSDIYFDFNPAIVTNTVSTQVTALATSDFIKTNFTIYPNPASNYITIEAKTSIESEYEIIDLNGKSLLKGKVQNLEPINTSALQSGFYFMVIHTGQGKATYKFIKK